MAEGINLEDMTVEEKFERLEWAFRNKDYGMYGELVSDIGRERIPINLWNEQLFENYLFEKRRRGYLLQPKLDFRVEKYSFVIDGPKKASQISTMGKSRKEIIEKMMLAGYKGNTDILKYNPV